MTVMQTFGNAIWNALDGQLWFWIKGYASFILLGSLIWIWTSRRAKGTPYRDLVLYLFPRNLYFHRTMKAVYFSLVPFVFVLLPTFILLAAGAYEVASRTETSLSLWLGHRPEIGTTWISITTQFVVFILSSSFATYGVHYAFHKVPILWSFHRVHHSAEALPPFAVFRFHPVEYLLTAGIPPLFGGVVTGAALYMLGAGQVHPSLIAFVALYSSWEVITGIFNHSHVPISYGWLNRIFYAPVLHQVHHSAELRHRDKNIGGGFNLVIWDHLFGTLYIPEKNETYRWGLNDEEFGDANPHLTVTGFYLEPFRHAWGTISAQRISRRVRGLGGTSTAVKDI
jgi:sterol desaturase/sphingolipid hydroxylase (fatty acid hydroxylase superfamily)